MKKSWLDLRRQYPNVPFAFWVKQIRNLGPFASLGEDDQEIIRLILADEEKEHQEKKEVRDRELQKIHDRIIGSLPHLKLDIQVPEGVDREYVQAILVYGFVPPTQRRVFAGKKQINQETVRQFIENKLGCSFNLSLLNETFRWLIRNGVVTDKNGLALNVSMKGCTAQGRELLQKTIEFSRRAE